MKAKIKEIAEIALDTILPPRCVVTGEMVDKQGMVAPGAWGELDFINDPMCYKCGVPFGFESAGMADIAGVETDDGVQCLQCMDYPPPYDSARSALKYNDHSRNMILGFKHADQTHAARAFVPWLKMAGAEMLEEADVLIPVPLHRWRLLKRRYNQSAIMAHFLHKETRTPILYEGLLRTRYTATQGHLNFAERRKNVKRAFVVNTKYEDKIKGKTLILLDDVYTTGSTAKECSKALVKAGAKAVHILTLARVVREWD